jgi:hypothetical protein
MIRESHEKCGHTMFIVEETPFEESPHFSRLA